VENWFLLDGNWVLGVGILFLLQGISFHVVRNFIIVVSYIFVGVSIYFNKIFSGVAVKFNWCYVGGV